MADPPPPPAASAPAAKSKARRSNAEEHLFVNAKTAAKQLPGLLSGIATHDHERPAPRIDKGWVAFLNDIIKAATALHDGRAIHRHNLKAVTRQERRYGKLTEAKLKKIRTQVQTTEGVSDEDKAAFGVGRTIDGRLTGPTIKMAEEFVLALNDPALADVARRAGIVTLIHDAGALAQQLSSFDLEQHGLIANAADGTLDKDATIRLMAKLTSFARTVVADVFGKNSTQSRLLTDVRPVVGAKGRKKKAGGAAKKKASTSPKKRKQRAQAVSEREQKLLAKRAAAKPAKSKRAKAKPAKSSRAKKTAKKGARAKR